MRAVAGLLVVALVLAGCSHPSSTTYDPADVATLRELGIVLARLRRFEGALDSLEKVRETAPSDYEALRAKFKTVACVALASAGATKTTSGTWSRIHRGMSSWWERRCHRTFP